MSVTKREVLKSNIVLVGIALLNSEAEIDAFRNAVDAEVTVELPGLPGLSLSSPLQEVPRLIKINRDRIVLNISPERSVIERQYPSADDLSRLADIASLAITHTVSGSASAPSAFGFNVEMLYESDTTPRASRYIADRLFDPELSVNDGWALHGGSAKLSFASGESLWNVAIEPRFQDGETPKVYFSLNLHRGEARLPSTTDIVTSLQETWTNAEAFVAKFDKVSWQ
ncbi:MAG: hypothetical protein F4Y97_00340 [Dehalococcoidia bacterium]|nr:hypothetical protein [Dehalococcoidia bacterium]